MLDAAALAAILDPERKVPGWWQVFCPMCLKEMLPASKNVCENCDIKAAVVFTGPPDLHTAREHAWRLEDWLIERGYKISISQNKTIVWDNDGGTWYEVKLLTKDPNHAAAIAEAVRRIANEN